MNLELVKCLEGADLTMSLKQVALAYLRADPTKL
jgi:hypothetical protein